MDRRTQALIAGSIVLLGIGVLALGFIEEESGVRYVEHITDDPASHVDGTYTLIGELQPPVLPAENGTIANDEWDDTITYGERIERNGQTILRTHSLSAEQLDHRQIAWTLVTREQATDSSGPGTVVHEEEWTTEGVLFQVDSFEEERTIWAVYEGTTDTLLRKPSQMEGRLADAPEGALIFQVDILAQQCSSKFVPEELRDEFDKDGDGLTD